jgi:hypothetical protein
MSLTILFQNKTPERSRPYAEMFPLNEGDRHWDRHRMGGKCRKA